MQMLAISLLLLVFKFTHPSSAKVDEPIGYGLPDSYRWLHVQITLMSEGGEIPELTNEQWLELSNLMTNTSFSNLKDVLSPSVEKHTMPLTTQETLLGGLSTKYDASYKAAAADENEINEVTQKNGRKFPRYGVAIGTPLGVLLLVVLALLIAVLYRQRKINAQLRFLKFDNAAAVERYVKEEKMGIPQA